MENAIRGQKFRDDEEVIEEVKMWLQQTPEERPCFHVAESLRKIWRLCRKIRYVTIPAQNFSP
jgi:hypothetical protein